MTPVSDFFSVGASILGFYNFPSFARAICECGSFANRVTFTPASTGLGRSLCLRRSMIRLWYERV